LIATWRSHVDKLIAAASAAAWNASRSSEVARTFMMAVTNVVTAVTVTDSSGADYPPW
jgi:hypothetical protein